MVTARNLFFTEWPTRQFFFWYSLNPTGEVGSGRAGGLGGIFKGGRMIINTDSFANKKWAQVFTVWAILLFASWAYPATIKVGLEPLPPLIVKESQGYTIALLRAVEAVSDLKFDIECMPYSRAKSELGKNTLQLIGHTPYQAEAGHFYTYAQELEFHIPVVTDIYVLDEDKLNNLANLKIGIPRGNEEFASKLLGLPLKNFYPGDLASLLKMLQLGRIDAFWFERASTISTLRRLQIKKIHYRKLPLNPAPAGMAVRNDTAGTRLKKRLDGLFRQIDRQQIFKEYDLYLKMPDQGVID